MSRTTAAVTLATIVMVGAGCGGVGDTSPSPISPASISPAPPSSASAAPSTVAPPPTVTPADGPPVAMLVVDGGDPVPGQLGTYVWREAGSDAPWLPGTPIAVGAGEVLVLSLDPPVTVAGWSARYAPTGSDGTDNATSLGDGTGPPALIAPPPGRWTVAVRVTVADGLGEATYFWAVEVR